MPKIKELPDYERRNFGQEPRASGPRTLPEGLKMFYPKLNQEEFEDWVFRIKSKTEADANFLQFVTLLCGAQFWLREANATGALEQLSFWLRSHPRRMRTELAELVVEAIGPGIIEAVANRGWQIGPDGSFVQMKGAPERSRGAWTAAILAQLHLRTVGVPDGDSTELSLVLVTALQGCEMKDPTELTRAKRTAGKPDPSELLKGLNVEWQFWCEHAVLKQAEADVSPDHRQEPLEFFLERFGSLLFSNKALTRMPTELWESFKKEGIDGNSI